MSTGMTTLIFPTLVMVADILQIHPRAPTLLQIGVVEERAHPRAVSRSLTNPDSHVCSSAFIPHESMVNILIRLGL